MNYLDRKLGLLNIFLGIAFFLSTFASITVEANLLANTQQGQIALSDLDCGKFKVL